MTGIVKTDQLQGAQGTTVTVPTGHTLAVTSNATVGGTLGVTGDLTATNTSGNRTLGIITGTSNSSILNMGDTDAANVGQVKYHHGVNSMVLRTNGSDKVTLDSTGNLLFNTAGTGVYLGVTSATAANLLDDYEEGTWTPQIYANGNITTSNITSSYTKVGKLVHLSAGFKRASSSGGSNILQITGLPFTSSSNPGIPGGAWIDNVGTDLRTLLYMGSGSTTVYFVKTGASSAYVSINELENARWIYLSITYNTA